MLERIIVVERSLEVPPPLLSHNDLAVENLSSTWPESVLTERPHTESQRLLLNEEYCVPAFLCLQIFAQYAAKD